VPVAKTKTAAANPMKELRARLSAVGVKRTFLNKVVLPSWWDDSLAESPGGFREGTGYICAHLGYSMVSLLDEKQPLAFVNTSRVKYKKARGISEDDVSLATHYALGVARAVAFAQRPPAARVPAPVEWRRELLAVSDKPWVCLRQIVEATWKLGIPVIHLRNVPAGMTKPDALTTMVGERPVIVVMNARKSPSWMAFILAHELGHLHHGHVQPGQTLVDEKIDKSAEEKDERDANDFASCLLTGHTNLGLNSPRRLNAQQLAAAVTKFGNDYRVAPGVAALNYGFTTGFWPVANGAVSILEKADDAGVCLRATLEAHLQADDFSEEAREWIGRATGMAG